MARELSKEVMWAAIVRWYPAAKVPSSIDDVSDVQCANAVRKWVKKYEEKNGKKALSQCTECGEYSPADEAVCPACPFCGEGGGVVEEKSGDGEQKVSSAKEAATMETKDEKKDGAAKANGSKPPRAKAAKPKAAKKAAAKPKAKKAAKAAIVPVVDEKKKAAMREKLDASVKSIRDLQREGQRAAYDIGRELEKVFAEQTWKARGKFKSFKEWCMLEMGFTTTWVRACIQVTKEFDRDVFLKIGPAKLAVIKALPPDERKPVIKMAEEGAGIRDLQKKVTKVREHLRAASGAGRGPGRPPVDPTISTAVKLSAKEQELVLFAAKLGKDGKPVPVDAFEPGCWTALDMGGGVWQRISFATNKAGAITRVLVKTSRKAAEAGAEAAPAATH